MKASKEAIGNLLKRKTVRHIFFSGFIMLFFLVGILTNAKSFKTVAPKGFLVYLFVMACLYAGRDLFKKWNNNKQDTIPNLASATAYCMILSLVCTLGSKFLFQTVYSSFEDFFLINLAFVITGMFAGISVTNIYYTFLKKKEYDNITPLLNKSEANEYVMIKTDGKIYKLRFDEIIYAEANRNYTKIVCNKATFMPVMSFSSFESLVPKTSFIRIHRSFIINKSKFTHIEGIRVFVEKSELPIGSSYKEEFYKEMGI